MCMQRDVMMTSEIRVPAEQWLPHTIKYSRLSNSTDQQQGFFKYQNPKTMRRKVLIFIFVVIVCFITIVFTCLNCYAKCAGFCHISSMKQGFMALAIQNKTYFSSNGQTRRLPQCIIIGTRKGGTRALLEYLNLHPDIVVTSKEQHFFNTNEKYALGLEYYRAQMPYSLSNQLTLEKTPAYFTDLMTPERIYRMNSSIKLLLIIREPVTRLVSDYTQLKSGKLERNKKVYALEELVVDANGEVDMDYKPVQRSMYYHYYVNWLEFFSRDQIYIANGDTLISNPYRELYTIESFLNLRHKIPSDAFYFNASKGFFCVKAEDLHSPCLSETKGRPHPKVDPAVLETLYDFYRPRNKLFFDLANKTFDWP